MCFVVTFNLSSAYFTVVPTKSDSDVILCYTSLSKNNVYTPLDQMQIDESLVY